jgi:hypothetical protein
MEQGGLTHRCEIVAADFFAAVPSGHDADVLGRVARRGRCRFL